MSECPKGGSHNWRNTHETATQVTHTCSKCGQTYTRPKAKTVAANLAFLLVAVVVLAVFAYGPIWMVAEVHP